MLTDALKSRFSDRIHQSLSMYMAINNEQSYYPWFVEDVENQFLMELLKMDYDQLSMEKACSFRKHRIQRGGNATYEDKRACDTRDFKKIKIERKERAEALKKQFGYFPSDLIIEDKKNGAEKFDGYAITDVQYEEIQIMSRYKIFEKLRRGQMADSKKIKNKVFIQYCDEYDTLLSTIKCSELSDEELIKSSFSFFVLQWMAPMEWIYHAAEAIEAKEIPESYAESMGLYLFQINDTEADFHADNRFLLSRERYIDLLCHATYSEKPHLEWHYFMQLYALQWLKNAIGTSVYEEIVHLPVSEKAEFIRNHYWILEQPERKVWTDQKVRIARMILNSVS